MINNNNVVMEQESALYYTKEEELSVMIHSDFVEYIFKALYKQCPCIYQ